MRCLDADSEDYDWSSFADGSNLGHDDCAGEAFYAVGIDDPCLFGDLTAVLILTRRRGPEAR